MYQNMNIDSDVAVRPFEFESCLSAVFLAYGTLVKRREMVLLELFLSFPFVLQAMVEGDKLRLTLGMVVRGEGGMVIWIRCGENRA